MKADGWGDDWSVGTLIDGVAAVALTFAIARNGLGALFGMLPWLFGSRSRAAVAVGRIRNCCPRARVGDRAWCGGPGRIEPRALRSSRSGIRLGACQRAGSMVLGRANAGRTRIYSRPAAGGRRHRAARCGRSCGIVVAAVALVGAGDGRLWGDLDCCSLPVQGAEQTGPLVRVALYRCRPADCRGSAAPGGRTGRRGTSASAVSRRAAHQYVGPQQLAGARPHGRHRPARRGR